jgi:hypothetical protein
VTFEGTVTPSYPGATVALEREVPGARRWRLLGRASVSAQGAYAITHTFGRAGVVDVRAVVRHRGTRSAASPTLSYETPRPQNPDLTIESSANPLTFGKAVTISGTLTGGAFRRVALLARTPGAPFAEVDQTTTDAQGSYSFSPRTPLRSTFYRVDAGSVHSTVVREGVAYQLALEPPPANVPVDVPLTVSGTVMPAHAGNVVFLERSSQSGLGFHPIATTTVSEDGSFSIVHSFRAAGTAKLRVTVPGDAENRDAISAVFSVQVEALGDGASPPDPVPYQLAG